MKKISIVILLFICSLCLMSFSNNALDNTLDLEMLKTAISNNKQGIITKTQNMTIINSTNYTDLTPLYDKSNDKFFIYNLGECEDTSILNNGNIMYYDFSGDVHSSVVIYLDNDEINNLSNNINCYYEYSIKENSKLKTYSDSQDSYFKLLYSSSYIQRSKPYGYIYVKVNVFKHLYLTTNSLYLATFDVSFTPGIVANANDEEGYQNYKLNSGYFHVKANQAIEDLGPGQQRLGGIPYFKEAYPTSSSGTATISSSVNTGYTFGYSFENGFSTSNSFEIKEGQQWGRSIDFSYQKTLTINDPMVSSQISPSSTNQYQWNFTNLTDTIKGKTFNFSCGYIFDIDARKSQTKADTLELRTDYKMNFLGNKSTDNLSYAKTGFHAFVFL